MPKEERRYIIDSAICVLGENGKSWSRKSTSQQGFFAKAAQVGKPRLGARQ
jgi:hypothetical protein